MLTKRRVLGAVSAYAAWQLYQKMNTQASGNKKRGAAEKSGKGGAVDVPGKKKKKEKFDRKTMIKHVRRLLKIVLPGLWSKEATMLSLYIAHLQGSIVKEIVEKNAKGFSVQMLKWVAIAIPASITNSVIRYMESQLALSFRTRLTIYAYDKYFEQQTFYKVCNLDGRLKNPDQNLTEDIAKFCSGAAHLYSHLSKPVLDVILLSAAIVRNNMQGYSRGPASASGGVPGASQVVRAMAPLGLAGGVIALTGFLLKLCSPPFGRLVAEEAAREGHLRFVHSRVITNAEEIAFLRGEQVERTVLYDAFFSLKRQCNLILKKRLGFVALEQFMMKYMWNASGNLMIAMAAFAPSDSDASVGDRTMAYSISNNLLEQGSDAIERILSSYKEVVELAGYSSRVVEMLDVFDDMREGRYTKTKLIAEMDSTDGKMIGDQDEISMKAIPIVTPNGDVLVKSMTLSLPLGRHVLVTGPNGCGKSSLFRILAKLWPLYGGELNTVNPRSLFMVPQRPYLTLGSFRAQVIYPDTVDDMHKRCVSDEDLLALLEKAYLIDIVNREGGLDSVREWKDVLSGGEKQRIGLARLFYHKPKYAFLDECTSAVSIDVEGQLYQHAKDLGITLLTITHRPSLWSFHDNVLQFDGEGGYKMQTLEDALQNKLLSAGASINAGGSGRIVVADAANGEQDVPSLDDSVLSLDNAIVTLEGDSSGNDLKLQPTRKELRSAYDDLLSKYNDVFSRHAESIQRMKSLSSKYKALKTRDMKSGEK